LKLRNSFEELGLKDSEKGVDFFGSRRGGLERGGLGLRGEESRERATKCGEPEGAIRRDLEEFGG